MNKMNITAEGIKKLDKVESRHDIEAGYLPKAERPQGVKRISSVVRSWRYFRCVIMGWHRPVDLMGFDGCSFTSTCRYCRKKILQDSQGNWF